jgi:DNA-binding Lrp family transcriptional regulator
MTTSTSAQAFDKVQPKVPSIKTQILTALERSARGLTREQLIEQTGVHQNSISGRITELKDEGRIKVTGQRANSRGNNEDVYAIHIGIVQTNIKPTTLDKALKAFSNLSKEDKRAALKEITISQYDWDVAGDVDFWINVHQAVGNIPAAAFTESGK